MHKTMGLALNKVSPVPAGLRAKPSEDVAADTFRLDLARLFHHYYLDSYGQRPPDPDPANFEHAAFLTTEDEFRFQGDGLGRSTEVRRNRSNELGRAMCRLALCDHFGIPYFADVNAVIDRATAPGFGGLKVERASSGDTPDYFCASSVDKVYLAEAKGRYSAVGFGRADFGAWRNQFNTVVVRDPAGQARWVKGFISASRFATESRPRVKSCLYLEDPQSPGDIPLGGEAVDIGGAVVAIHYSRIFEKLGFDLFAAALAKGFRVPDELRFNAVSWRCHLPPYAEGTRFVGGVYRAPDAPSLRFGQDGSGNLMIERPPVIELPQPRHVFVGLEEDRFLAIASTARQRLTTSRWPEPFPLTGFVYSALSVLPDGSVLGPLDLFAPDRFVEF